jgi:pyruvate carboxylase
LQSHMEGKKMHESTRKTSEACRDAMCCINGFTSNRNFKYTTKEAAVQGLEATRKRALQLLDCAKPQTKAAMKMRFETENYIEKRFDELLVFLDRKSWN